MALIPCPECNHQVSDQAKACPSCGFGVSESRTFDSTRYTDQYEMVHTIRATPKWSSNEPKGRSRKFKLGLVIIIGMIFLVPISALIVSFFEQQPATKATNLSSRQQSASAPKFNAHITTYVDGTDVGIVNLWSSASSNRSVKCSLANYSSVRIIKSDGPYYFVESSSGCRGYCMKGFVVRN